METPARMELMEFPDEMEVTSATGAKGETGAPENFGDNRASGS